MGSDDVMATLSPNEIARARKSHSLIVRAVAAVGQEAISDAIGKDASTVSRMMNPERLGDYVTALSVAGLKVVSGDSRCYSPQKYGALLVLAIDALTRGPEKITDKAKAEKFDALRLLALDLLKREVGEDELGPTDAYECVRTLAMESLAREVQREQPAKPVALDWGSDE